MKEQFYFFYDSDMLQQHLFRDLSNIENVKMYSSCISHKGIIGLVEKVATSIKINNVVHVPMQHLFYSMEKIGVDESCDNYFIFTTESLLRMSSHYLNQYKKNHNVKFILIILDSFHASSPTLKMVRAKIETISFDVILTYDKEDAEEFGFKYFGFSYYSAYEMIDVKATYDVYFVGGIKGERKAFIENTAKHLLDKVKIKFDIYGDNERSIKNDSVNYLSKWLSYDEIIQNVFESRCILEILQNGQHTQSLRYFEAVCYNKMLITNNQYIRELPYYNPEYMKIIEKPTDIDLEWLKEKKEIDYGYQGEFSPKELIKKIPLWVKQ